VASALDWSCNSGTRLSIDSAMTSWLETGSNQWLRFRTISNQRYLLEDVLLRITENVSHAFAVRTACTWNMRFVKGISIDVKSSVDIFVSQDSSFHFSDSSFNVQGSVEDGLQAGVSFKEKLLHLNNLLSLKTQPWRATYLWRASYFRPHFTFQKLFLRWLYCIFKIRGIENDDLSKTWERMSHGSIWHEFYFWNTIKNTVT